MALNIKTNRMLWGRAASRCSLPDCRRELVIDPVDTDDPSLVGEAAHIVAQQPEGPRGESSLPTDQRNTYSNLILLCNVHHKQIDDQVNHFTVERLNSLKNEHEKWVRTSLAAFDAVKQAVDERWAGYIEEWASRADLDRWLDQTYGLLQPTPEVDGEFFNSLASLREWLLSRIWPDRYPDLRSSLNSFRMAVGDFVNVFSRHSTERDRAGPSLRTEKFYKIDPERHEMLLKRYEHHVDLVHDLVLELTRAANFVCDKVRGSLDPSFRVAQGVLLVRRGAGLDLMEHTYRPEYRLGERSEQPYPGLEKFVVVRTSRDLCIGAGEDQT